MKTVAIIGAGPAGLVAAKTLLRSNTSAFSVRIFDKASSIGGLWNADSDHPHDGMLNPEMPTNISRFNMSFSDLAWQSIGLPGHIPYFPRAWMAGRYLHAYSQKYIPQDAFMLSSRVTKAVRVEEGDGAGGTQWRLTWEKTATDGAAEQGEDVFDYVVMAAGFFPAALSPDAGRSGPGFDGSSVKQAHSTAVRSLADVVPSSDTAGTLLIVGAGMSGADVTTNLAAERSNALHAPGADGTAYKNLKMVQIVPASFYAMPLMIPRFAGDPLTKAPEFITLDLALYDLGRRPPGQIELGIGKLSEVFMQKSHDMFKSIAGGDQSEYRQAGIPYNGQEARAAHLSITEQYSEYLRAGDVTLVPGRYVGLKAGDSGKATAMIQSAGETVDIKDVVGVVYATGFTHHPALSLLPTEVLEALEYDPHHTRLPLILDQFYTRRESQVSNLAFIGYHEGASWPGMEMQARLVSQRWSCSSSNTTPGPTNGNSTNTNDSFHEVLRGLRKSMAARDPDVPMYWKGDYVGLMETLSREVGVQRNDEALSLPSRSGPVSAARYADAQADPSEVSTALGELKTVLDGSRNHGLFVARAAFRALHGTWKISRRLDSSLANFPSGKLEGTAWFHPRYPTAEGFDSEYLYVEQGSFVNEAGLTFGASRRYVYRYCEAKDRITVWFVKEDGKTVDYFFHDLGFEVEGGPEGRKDGWVARADHLCIKDMYESMYRFEFRGANVRVLEVVHKVKGPAKDYVSRTTYSRESRGKEEGWRN